MDYLEETKEKDRYIIDNFEKNYEKLFLGKNGDFTEAEELLLNEYLSADKREYHRKKRAGK